MHAQHLHDVEAVDTGIRALLRLLGRDPDAPDVQRTPERWRKAMLEFGTRPADPAELLDVTFDSQGADEMVTVGPVRFVSLCEHHLLPFTGQAWVGYLPRDGKIVGLSKIPRLIDALARAPQVQERLTRQIADAMVDHLGPRGVGVQIVASHSCTTLRGARAETAQMVTTAVRGVLLHEPAARAEWTEAIRNTGGQQR